MDQGCATDSRATASSLDPAGGQLRPLEPGTSRQRPHSRARRANRVRARRDPQAILAAQNSADGRSEDQEILPTGRARTAWLRAWPGCGFAGARTNQLEVASAREPLWPPSPKEFGSRGGGRAQARSTLDSRETSQSRRGGPGSDDWEELLTTRLGDAVVLHLPTGHDMRPGAVAEANEHLLAVVAAGPHARSHPVPGRAERVARVDLCWSARGDRMARRQACGRAAWRGDPPRQPGSRARGWGPARRIARPPRALTSDDVRRPGRGACSCSSTTGSRRRSRS